ncbi:trk system potassium uptake protein TrkH [Shimia gijangensis]|uniref:Trk system potassium uptake protein TrkH n=1 Tax=Shimia gijangensis TaxID=1470563 RepID=A0A1M6HNJ1_9RHOB|nr:potassium transporter TrkG [Shimia gijangensis]SHJ23686.1 trk system potassium uptake protein TrkH [Shimia gijangensis]
MIARLSRLPLFLLFVGISGVAMLVPALYAGALHDLHEARSFFYSAILVLFVFGLIALAMSDTGRPPRTVDMLMALFLGFTVLPIVLALPFWWGLATTSYLNAYFEMVSSFTTTGATLFDVPGRLSPSLHLWRGLVGWLGGLLMWIAAAAVFAPLSLGGFEVTTRSDPGIAEGGQDHVGSAHPMKRWHRGAITLIPIYSGLTLVVWVMLLILGEKGITGLVHAMSVMATSGISSVGGVANAKAGIGGEIVLFLFMLFALSRTTFSSDTGAVRRDNVLQDYEFRLGLLIVVVVPAFLFLRHWLGAYEVNELRNATAAVRAAWGSTFTVLSFLTTTGFESVEWQTSQDWSGLSTPGLLLMGLAIVGGGVATTAGGVKLLRVYVLYLQGYGEMQKLVHPSIVVGRSSETRVRRKGAEIAWVFFMLFAMSLALITVALAGLGAGFQDALIMAVASLTTTGPLVNVAAEAPIDLVSQTNSVKLVMCAAMALGRLETLAIIALLSRELWHK